MLADSGRPNHVIDKTTPNYGPITTGKHRNTEHTYPRPVEICVFPESACEGFFVKNICRTTPPLHLHIFTSAQSRSHLYLCSSSHLHIYISAHLHILTSTSQLIFIFTHLHLCSSSHLHIYISAHLHILTSTSHIFTARSS